jgi:hypothetical protein
MGKKEERKKKKRKKKKKKKTTRRMRGSCERSAKFNPTLSTFPCSRKKNKKKPSLSWLSVYPIDVIKTRIQAGDTTPILNQVRELGVRGLSRGLGWCLLRAAPVNAVTFWVQDAAMKALRSDSFSSWLPGILRLN